SLIMMGKEKSIQKLLGHSETIFEYRSEKSRIEPDKRIEFKKGFLGYLEEICNVIELYNKKQQIRGDNLFITEIPTFRMNVIREALLNAFCHRDYRDGNSINIKLTSSSLDIISPGGLPEGIDIDNIIDQTNPRNRLIAESLQKCGLVERAGQGYDMMWKSLLKDSKNGPDLSNTTSNQVHLSIQGHVLDPNFIQYIDQLTNFDISIHELITLWHICTGQQIKKNHCNTDTIKSLKQKRLIENIGYGKGTKYILSREYYVTANKRGEYSRNKGLPDAENKLLILQHIKDHGQGKMQDFEQLLQNINRTHIQTLLRQLKIEGKIKHVGSNKTGMWIIC
ncbi:MAG TPA: ATP-binding protein, partial [Caldisericia bacterium]|nr:ATP-binding protein [Caldisericia bacterium]